MIGARFRQSGRDSSRTSERVLMAIANIAQPTRDMAAPRRPGPLSHGERWYAVHTLPFAEARAEGHLHNQGFRTFQPKRQKTIRHARRLSTVEVPYFPRYLFIVLDMTRDQWRSVNGTFGVSRLVMWGDRPHPVPPGVVETMIASADPRGILQLARKLQVGGRVRLMAGPLAEQLAILDELDDSGRVRLLLDILGRQVATLTNANNVMPL
jgi:transcription elongation factor/antiterminator RfaH